MDEVDEHQQVKSSRGFEVDKGILSLLELLWQRDIETELSCQGSATHRAWINFPTSGDACRFIKLAVPQPENADISIDSLYNRAYRVWELGNGSDDAWIDAKGWSWDVFLENQSYAPIISEDEENAEDHFCNTEAAPSFSITVRFPPTDIPLLMENLAKNLEPARA